MTTPPRKRRFRWRSLIVPALLVLSLLCVGGVLIARQLVVREDTSGQSVITQVVPVEQGDLVEMVQINGTLEPRDSALVSFQSGARVAEVLVTEGQQVKLDDVLARLETRDLELKVAGAQAAVDQARQDLDKLNAGPTEVELAQAAAAVARARADLAAANGEVRPIDVEVARGRLETARQKLADLEAGIAPDDLTAAEKQLIAADDALTDSRETLEQTRDSASRAKTDAQQAMERGVQELDQAQRAYSDAYWDWDYVQRTGRHPREKVTDENGVTANRDLEDYEIRQFERTFIDAGVALKNAELSLQNLREAFDQARESEIRQIQDAERAVATAERNLAEARRDLDKAQTRGVAAALLAARQELAEAEKAYKDLTDNPQRPAQRAALEAALLEAIANQKKLAAGSDPAAVAKARTALEQARADLAEAEANLEAATLRAPIAGTVVDISLKAGTLAGTNDAIRIADLSAFLIRGQVTEQSVAQVQVGQSVQIAVDAVPGASFRGKLVRVSELPDTTQSQSSDMVSSPFGPQPGTALGGLYPVEIEFNADDKRLRVGMATTANIEILAIPDTLIIPLQAVEEGPQGSMVRRATGANDAQGQPIGEPVPVELGAVSGDRVQVLAGLSAGDQVILPQIPMMETPPGGMGGP